MNMFISSFGANPRADEKPIYAAKAPTDVDITASKIARALYDHGPCSARTIAIVAGDPMAADTLRWLAQKELISSRVVNGVELLWLRGHGVG